MYIPNFTLTNKILKNIGEIEACKAVIHNAPLVPAWEAKFREEAIIRTVHHGTHIEGNELNLTEAGAVLKGQNVIGRERDIQEVLNFRNVLKYIDQLSEAEGQFAYSEKVLKEIHKLTTDRILPYEKSGVYRKTQVVVKNSVTGEITFRPPPAIEVAYLVRDFLEWLRDTSLDTIHPVLKSAITQYEIVRIHPFVDGNGRVARAFTTLVLFKEKYDINKFFSLEEYYDRDAADYYAALQAVSKSQGNSTKRDLTPWLEYFTLGLSVELNRIKEKVLKLSTDVHLKEKLGGKQIHLSERQISIVEYIQKTGYLQNKSFSELFPKISEDTILRDIKDLINKGIIKKRGKTKAARYVLKG